MRHRKPKTISRLLCGSAAIALTAWSGLARAEERAFNIEPQPLSTALMAFGAQSGHAVMAPMGLMDAKVTRGLAQSAEPEVALAQLLEGTGLTYTRSGDTFAIVQGGSDPQPSGAAGDGAGTVEALIVTAQKREEDIQDVPIAISAFSQEDLETRQVAGGPDLITQIPNFSFTKTNFTSYSIQIRGIGTQAISATTDPAVAVAFNNTPFVRNRFFEQEFYDLERLEVLRGPQGTLYGRNATAGVVNIISAKPKFIYEAKASADIGNYSSNRIEGMINIPLVEDVVALRLAGAWTKREGYAFNQMTGRPIDGRDLWSTRLSLRFEPTDWISANLIWEHFEEDDDRLRSGKQLCKKDVGPTQVNGVTVTPSGGYGGTHTYLTQGCVASSLYSPEAFQTPNGFSLPYYGPTSGLGNPVNGNIDPYVSATQSRDLRVIESSVEPIYRANADIAELQVAIDLTDSLTLNSETSYSIDALFSLQDYNRFSTARGSFRESAVVRPGLVENGVFCDPQLGCSDRLLLVDLSTSDSSQFSQEFRLGSDFDGQFNFSVGANYLRHDAEDKYYVFINSLTLFAGNIPGALGGTDTQFEAHNNPYVAGITDNAFCVDREEQANIAGDLARVPDPSLDYSISSCPYIDPNPIGSLNDQGRNYFLSRNPYKLISYAAFGELYYNITDDLKLTAGFRWTVDRKTAPQIPSWLLASFAAGTYPTAKTVFQEWSEPTGRLAIDWHPDFSFTDETLVYASYSHGYKAGGANPPPPILVSYASETAGASAPGQVDTFDAEFVDAFEVGTKNTLFGGVLTLNFGAFYYDYKDYQISEIVDRSAANSNYDAEIWGAELEADWRVTEALRLGVKGGYQNTRMADGSSHIDLIDRTAGQPGWRVFRPFPTVPSNCILPDYVIGAGGDLHLSNRPTPSGMCVAAYYFGWDPITGRPYDPSITNYALVPGPGGGGLLGPAYASYPGFDPSTAPNGGRGFEKDLSGNELPNAPNYTATVTVDYSMPLAGDWLLTLHGDYHYQSDSWARIFNSDPYDRIEAFSTVNVAGIFTHGDAGWKVMAYVKNVFDQTAITGSFLNSDDSGLTTNVFLTEPRLYGVRVTKEFDGGGWLGEIGRCPDGVCPVTIEIGGGVSLFGNDDEAHLPGFVDEYEASFPKSLAISAQNQDLDWGDMRDVKLTYALPGGSWRVSGTYRFGRANGQARSAGYEDVPSGRLVSEYNGKYIGAIDITGDNHLISVTRGSEEFELVDFIVGKEIGIGAVGAGGKSSLGFGLRYANLTSVSHVGVDGVPDRFITPYQLIDILDPPSPPGSGGHSSRYTVSLSSERDFEGTGPTIRWDAAVRLWGDDDTGHADVDWSVGGGVLFGKQEMASTEDRVGRYYLGIVGNNTNTITTTHYDEVVPRARTGDVTVPNLSLTLGLSYAIDRVKVSTGYSYDRFFDAIDGGYEEAQSYDRTIHGPYLKLSLGFGG